MLDALLFLPVFHIFCQKWQTIEGAEFKSVFFHNTEMFMEALECKTDSEQKQGQDHASSLNQQYWSGCPCKEMYIFSGVSCRRCVVAD